MLVQLCNLVVQGILFGSVYNNPQNCWTIQSHAKSLQLHKNCKSIWKKFSKTYVKIIAICDAVLVKLRRIEHETGVCPMRRTMPRKDGCFDLLPTTDRDAGMWFSLRSSLQRIVPYSPYPIITIKISVLPLAVRLPCSNSTARQSHAASPIWRSGTMKSVGFGHRSVKSHGDSDSFDACVLAMSGHYSWVFASYFQFA